MKPHLSIQELAFAYSHQNVLSNISFQVGRGDFIGIIGPNGSGKSTLLHLISGLLRPQRGFIAISGSDTSSLSRRQWSRAVAIVFQEVNPDLDLECLEVVMMGRFPHWTRWQKEDQGDSQTVQKAMNATSTWHLSQRRFRELSGGEKQRVMIARALAQEPEILLLDEPTSHLDILHQLDILQILTDLHKNQITILGVFHDVNLVSQFCTQVLFLKKGEVISYGRVEDVLHAGKMEQLFEVEFLEETHPYTFRPFFLPLGKKKVSPDKSLTVHLVCGGGSGYPFIREFLEGGMMVSVGIVNQLDSDEELATKLGLTVVREKPFSPFSDSTVQNALAVSREADFIVIAPVFWGWGNLKNLELAQNLLREGKKVLLLQESLDPKLDYTEGTAIQLLQQLIQEGAQVFLDLPALITHLL